MLLRNLITGSTPGVLHRNGNPAEWQLRWEQTVAAFFAEAPEPCDPCPELTIVTWSNRPTKSVLERCLDRWRLPYVILGRRVPEWRNDMKLYLNATALAHARSAYVLALDSDDVLVISSPQRILAEFQSFGCEMLFSTEKNSRPEVPNLTDFERSIAESPYCHLNSGAWIGNTDACRRFFVDCLAEDNGDILALHPTRTIFRDDQGPTRKTFRRYHPSARLDYQCRIFQSLSGVEIDGEVLIQSPQLSRAADRDGSVPSLP